MNPLTTDDPLVDEVRAIRDTLAKQFGYDIERLGREMQARDAQSGRETVRLSPRRVPTDEATPGDPRDTTTPAAMVSALKALLLGDTLTAASRQELEAWMVACTTGRAKLRAGLPVDWIAGDKTGSGQRGTMNDIAILRPPRRAPILLAVYATGSKASWADREAVFAEVGRIVAGDFKD